MGPMREALEASLSVAIELENINPVEHAALIAGARIAANALDSDDATASMLGTYLNYCKSLGVVPNVKKEQAVVGGGRLAKMRSRSRAGLRAV